MTITEFIELHQAIYRLDRNTFNKIKTKVSRELQNIPSWFELQETQTVGKTTAYILDEETKKALTIAMRPYFQKLAGIRAEDLNQPTKVTETDIETGFVRDSRTSDEGYRYTVPKEDKMYVMIASLFNERFELDEHAWNEDYTTHQIFMSDEEAKLSDSVAIASYRLKDPIQNYVKIKD